MAQLGCGLSRLWSERRWGAGFTGRSAYCTYPSVPCPEAAIAPAKRVVKTEAITHTLRKTCSFCI